MKISRKTAYLLGGIALGVVTLLVAGTSPGVFKTSKPVTLSAGTELVVRLDHAVASDTHRSGDPFTATVAAPVRLNGKEVIPAGTRARGHVVEARESGRLQTPAVLTLALDEVQVGGAWYDMDTAIVGRRGASHKKRNWMFIGGGAAGGALLGGLAGGGKGAAIGAGAGAGAGTAAAALTGKKEIRFPAESQITFRLSDPLTVDVATNQKQTARNK